MPESAAPPAARAAALPPLPTAADYAPPRWLRNTHMQSVLSSSQLRRVRGARALAATGAEHVEHLLDAGDGVRLHGWHSRVPGRAPRALAVLFHGWEGSSESGYMRFTATRLLEAGFDVFRLNFRDHGDTHHLNPGLFHSNRLDEVLHAVRSIAALFPGLPMVAAGYSLGGNFALRVARAAPAAGLPLLHAAAVCPVLDPAEGMNQLERAWGVYHWYFMRKWTGSLKRKRALFPEEHAFDPRLLSLDMRELTRRLVVAHAGFDTLEDYFDGYSVAGDRLAGLQVPVSVLTAEDDPIIPVEGFRRLALPAHSRVEISPWGGHCGFLLGRSLEGFAERWVTGRLGAALG